MADQAMKQKRILMFCTGFFGYDKRLAGAFRSAGYEVDLFDERPGTGFLHKSCIRFNVSLYRPVIRKYIRSVIEKVKENEYDYIFVVKGEGITEEAIEMLREAFPKAKTILYLWDSVQNIPECVDRMRHYHKVFTFDPEDAKKYSLGFRPLFYAEEYESYDSDKPAEYWYDVSFIGTAHTDRPYIVNAVSDLCQKQNKKCFSFLYSPHIMVYYFNRLFNPYYRKVKKEDLSFSPMSSDRIREIYDHTRCVLDVEHSGQRGLTMRTIELVGMKKKIITTNRLIQNYDFYHPANVCILDRANPVIDESFWEQEYQSVPKKIQERYTLRSFVRELLS